MSTLSDKFGLSKDQVRDTLDFLESNSKVIKRHYRTIDGRTGKLSNVMYIELIPTVLMNLTYLDSADGGNIPESTEISSTSYLEKSEEILENLPPLLEKTPIHIQRIHLRIQKRITQRLPQQRPPVLLFILNLHYFGVEKPIQTFPMRLLLVF